MHILKLKCTKFDFGCTRLVSGSAGGAYSATSGPLAGFKGPYFQRYGMWCAEWGGDGQRRVWRGTR